MRANLRQQNFDLNNIRIKIADFVWDQCTLLMCVSCVLQVSFSEETNMGGYIEGQTMTKSALDNMFSFSASLGFDYYGLWKTKKRLVITIINENGAGPPLPQVFTLSVKASGNLRNFPAACAPTARYDSFLLLELLSVRS